MANEYAVNQADLVAVADKIRAKTGESDSLEFPSDFLSALASIVDVPSNISALASGTFTLTKNTEHPEITHNLGVVPNFYLVRAQEQFNSSIYNNRVYVSYGTRIGEYCLEHLAHYVGDGMFSVRQVVNGLTASQTYFYAMGVSGGCSYKFNCVYHWICGVIDEV